MHTPSPARLAVVLIALSSCGDAVPPAAPPVPAPEPVAAPATAIDAALHLPLEEGRRWTYEYWHHAGATTVEAVRKGGDVRTLEGRDGVRYVFTYGDIVGGLDDATKSIHAAPPEGPRLYYLDGWDWRMGYDPPLVLLPAGAVVGTQWSWTGQLDIPEGDYVSRAELVVAGIESVTVPAGTFRAVRVEESHDKHDLRITRWYAPGVGLVREDHELWALIAGEVYESGKLVEGAAGAVVTRRRGARLIDYSPPE